eukprot:scaffold236_cov419-Prasinococcus_capsulatus_cf.AAC.4
MEELRTLWLYNNALEGPLPTLANRELRAIWLYGNNLTGTIPNSWAKDATQLHTLYLGNNNLT